MECYLFQPTSFLIGQFLEVQDVHMPHTLNLSADLKTEIDFQISWKVGQGHRS
jgi:hypothetical protein